MKKACGKTSCTKPMFWRRLIADEGADSHEFLAQLGEILNTLIAIASESD
jgi:hypothetical protein